MRRSGSLLIITLWLVTILTVLAVAVARYLSLEVKVTKYALAREQAEALARSGVYVAMQQLVAESTQGAPPSVDWAGEAWAVAQPPLMTPRGEVQVTMIDEERKLNLNLADEAMLTRLTNSPVVAKAIIDYRDPAEDGEDHPPYLAKNERIAAREELLELPDLAQDADRLYPVLAEAASPYLPDDARLNINTAPAPVLRALGLSDVVVDVMERFRLGPDGPEAHAQDGIFEGEGTMIVQRVRELLGPSVDFDSADFNTDRELLGIFGTSSQTFTVTAAGSVAQPAVHISVEAVVRRNGCPAPAGGEAPQVCIVAWKKS